MANELLKSPEGDAVPQKLAEDASIDSTDLSGDDTAWAIFDDPAQGGGSTLQDVVDEIGGTLEVTDDGSFNATVDGTVQIEADDGSDNVSSIQQTDNGLQVYLSGQDSEIDIDLAADNGVGVATESTLSDLAKALASNSNDTLHVDQQSPVKIEADDGTDSVETIRRTDYSLHTLITGQDVGSGSFSVDLEADKTAGGGLAEQNTLDSIAKALESETSSPDSLRVKIQDNNVTVINDVSQVYYEGSTYTIETIAETVTTNGDNTIKTVSGSNKLVVLSYNYSIEGAYDFAIKDANNKKIDAVQGYSRPVEGSRDPTGPVGETGEGYNLVVSSGGSTVTANFRFSYIMVPTS